MTIPALVSNFYDDHQSQLDFITIIQTPEKITLRVYQPERALEINRDMSVTEKLPGWFILGDNDEDGLFCVHAKSGRCAIVPIEPLSMTEAMNLSQTFQDFFSDLKKPKKTQKKSIVDSAHS